MFIFYLSHLNRSLSEWIFMWVLRSASLLVLNWQWEQACNLASGLVDGSWKTIFLLSFESNIMPLVFRTPSITKSKDNEIDDHTWCTRECLVSRYFLGNFFGQSGQTNFRSACSDSLWNRRRWIVEVEKSHTLHRYFCILQWWQERKDEDYLRNLRNLS